MPQVDARQYPVVTHFAKRTEVRNYLRETHKKVVQIHKRLPDGTILVFLTGKREILYMCQKLTKSLNKKRKAVAAEAGVGVDSSGAGDAGGGGDRRDADFFHGEGDEGDDSDGEEKFEDQDGVDSDDDDDDDDESHDGEDGKDSDGQSDEGSPEGGRSARRGDRPPPRGEGSAVDRDADDSEDFVALRSRMLKEALGSAAAIADDAPSTATSHQDPTQTQTDVESEPEPEPMRALVLPLYAMMPTEKQQMVFEPPPAGYRLIIVATNVAVCTRIDIFLSL